MPDPRMEQTVRAVEAALMRAAHRYRPKAQVRVEGRVITARDGVLAIEDLPDARIEQLLEIERSRALVLGLGDHVQAVALDGAAEAGQTVRLGSGRLAIPVSDRLIGRVVDPLGRPLDGQPLALASGSEPIDRPAPQIYERAAVHMPLFTGILAIDAMLPIGRGQRELVLGDEGTGKTSLVVDAILRQRDTGVVSVYVAIGRRRAEVWRIADELRRGAGRWVIVAAPEDAPPAMRYLAAYSGTAVAEHFMRRGDHALVVYDDLSAHAVAWRELSLLMRRPPGREAYPGDVFYLHARLLERAAQLSSELGGGSLTALPVASLEGGRLTGYVPTNLISITDGQIVLSQPLFAAGQRPAIDVGLSVSRVGAKAQVAAMRALAGPIKLDYATFLELEIFARMGTRLDTVTNNKLERGRRLRALLGARRASPLSVLDEVVRLVVAAHPALTRIPEEVCGAFATDVAATVRRDRSSIATRIERDGVLPKSDRESLDELVAATIARRFPEPSK